MKVFEFFARQSEKRPWLVVIIVGLVTIFLAAGFPRVSTELSQEGMMPKNYESVQALDIVNERFGGLSFETVLLESDDVTSREIIEALLGLNADEMVAEGFNEGDILKIETYLDFLKYNWPEMAEKLQEMTGTELPKDIDSFLETMNDAMFAQFMDFYLDPDPSSPVIDALASLSGNGLTEDAKAQLMATFMENAEHIKGTLNEERTATLIKFQVNPDLTQNQQLALARNLDDFIERRFGGIEGAETYISGTASQQRDSQEFMQKETTKLLVIALIFIMLILYLTFRRGSDIALPLLIIFVGIAWIFGLMGWVGITYTTMSVAIMPLMLGINIAYVIHILSRYYEEREDGLSVDLSATTSIKTVGVAVFLTAVTTMIGFSSFLITDIPPMRDFGLLCLLGIAFSFLLSITLLPAIVVIRDRRKKKEKLEAHLEKMRARRRDAWYGKAIDNSLVSMATVSERHHWIVAIVTVLLVAFGLFAVFNVRTGADVSKMMPEELPSRKASQRISDIFGPQNSDVILVEGDIYDPANLVALLELEDAIAADERNQPGNDDYFLRDNIQSIADLIVLSSPDGSLPDSRQEVENVVSILGTRMPVSAFVTEDGESAMIILKSGFPETEDEFIVKADIMRDQSAVIMGETDLKLTSTGMTVLIGDLLGNILPTQLKTSGLALLLCALVLILVFKSFTFGLATLIVVVIGMMAELVFLYALGWPLDIMTVMVASLVIGAGIDFGIHITHRFREEWQDGEVPLEEAIKKTVLHVGRALVAAAFTTCGVFIILGFSSMEMMKRFGYATAVGLAGALLGAIIVLPSILAIATKSRSRRLSSAVAPPQEAGAEPAPEETT